MPPQRPPRTPAGSREPGRGGTENHVPETDEGHRRLDGCHAAWAPAVAWACASGEHLAPPRGGWACHCPALASARRPARKGTAPVAGWRDRGNCPAARGPSVDQARPAGSSRPRLSLAWPTRGVARRPATRSAAGRSGANGSPAGRDVGADDAPAPLAGYCPLKESQRGPRLECGSDREPQTWHRRACRTAPRFVGAPPLRPPTAGPAPAAPGPCYGQAITAASLGASSRRAIGSKK
jgi:hypothetical protein